MNSPATPYAVSDDVWMVPCVRNVKLNQFEPLNRPFSSALAVEKLQTRHVWLTAEDEALRQIVGQKGARAWARVATALNELVHKGLPIRQAKQCRERYLNHIDPRLVKAKWTNFEDLTILKQHVEVGNRWSLIAKALPGRTENQVKNRFKSLLKKATKTCPPETDPILFFIQEKELVDLHVPRPNFVKS